MPDTPPLPGDPGLPPLERGTPPDRFEPDAYRAVFEATGSPMIVVDGKGKIVLATTRFLELSHHDSGTVENSMPFLELVQKDLRNVVKQIRLELPASPRASTSYQFVLRCGNNSVCQVQADEHRLPNPSMSIITLSNRTAHAMMENALRVSEHRYRSLAEHANDMIMVTEANGRITYANPAAQRMVGLDSYTPGSRNVLEWIPPEYHPHLKRMYALRRAGNTDPHAYEIELLPGDGRRLILDVSTVAIARAGQYPEILVIARDITERKNAERILHQEQRRLRLVLEAAQAYIAFFDEEGRFTLVNHRYAEIVGHKPEDLIGKRPDEALLPDVWKIVESRYTRVQRGEMVRFEEALKLPGSPGVRWYSGTYSPILGVDGGYRGHVAVVLDITEQKEAELLQQERESLEVARKLARTVAHEFRQPLTALRLISDLARMSADQKYIETNLVKIPDLVTRMDGLVSKLVDITNLKTKAYLPDMDILDLSDDGAEADAADSPSD